MLSLARSFFGIFITQIVIAIFLRRDRFEAPGRAMEELEQSLLDSDLDGIGVDRAVKAADN